MKKILQALLLFTLFISTFCPAIMIHPITVKATEVNPVTQIQITQFPSKITYSVGENLDLSDMIITSYYLDGTSNVIDDYEVIGYNNTQIGNQVITISYQNYTASFTVTVNPPKINHVTNMNKSTSSISLTWDSVSDITNYEVYMLDQSTGSYNYFTSTISNSITLNENPGTIHNFQIRAIKEIDGIKYVGEFSDTYSTATKPNKVTGLSVLSQTSTSIKLSWNKVAGATGYFIYRSPITSNTYTYCGTTKTISFTDKNLSSGVSYKYKVTAYTLDKSYVGAYSVAIKTSTNPAKISLNGKAGDQKIRLTWAKVAGASSYDIYRKDTNSEYSLLVTNTGNANCTYIADGLVTGETYTFYGVANRDYDGQVYSSQDSSKKTIKLTQIMNTSTTAKYLEKESDFLKSNAFTEITFFKNNVDYSKSIIIPGLITTNINGFSSISMCPQGITFAGDYLLITAYDRKSEENSVVYVVDKSTKGLVTTLILPSKIHAGGITFDGTNIWITSGKKLASIPFVDIETAASEGAPYIMMNFNTSVSLGITASFVTFYNDMIWVGTYNELNNTKLYGYTIEEKDLKPSFTKVKSIDIPTRVQGIAFTNTGYLLLSRSCQLYQGLRGYMRQIDVYKPDFSDESKETVSLGACINTVEMPSMNEGIAIDGSYLYVNFESAAFDNASFKMDRVCAFKLSSLLKKATPDKTSSSDTKSDSNKSTSSVK